MERKPVHLIMVTAVNNNKYYDMVPKGDYIEIKYGRVDSTCTTIQKPISEWDKIYKSKIKKGYVDQSDLVADLVEKVVPKKDLEYKPIPNKVIANIVERLQDFAQKAIDANYKVKANQVTQAMIDAAQTILIKLHSCTTVKDFNNLLLELYTTIPRKMGHVQDYLASNTSEFSDMIDKEQALLDVMKGQVVVVQLSEPTNEEEEYKNNCTILEALGIEISETKPKDVALIKKELGDIANKYVNSWKIKNIETEKRFKKFMKDNNLKEFKYLWHGTRNENLWSILQKGLLLRPELVGIRTNGKMLGYAIYSSPTPRKSYNYTSNGYWTGGYGNKSVFMILNKVALGNIHDIYSFDSKYYDFTYEKLQKEAPGCHSMWAHAGMNTGWGSLQNDEIVVYKEDQITCNYLVELN